MRHKYTTFTTIRFITFTVSHNFTRKQSHGHIVRVKSLALLQTVTLKMQDQKKEDHIAGLENAGLENVGPYDRAGKSRTGKCGTM